MSTAIAVKTGSYGFFGTCPCILCGSIPCSPHRIQTLKTNPGLSLDSSWLPLGAPIEFEGGDKHKVFSYLRSLFSHIHKIITGCHQGWQSTRGYIRDSCGGHKDPPWVFNWCSWVFRLPSLSISKTRLSVTLVQASKLKTITSAPPFCCSCSKLIWFCCLCEPSRNLLSCLQCQGLLSPPPLDSCVCGVNLDPVSQSPPL